MVRLRALLLVFLVVVLGLGGCTARAGVGSGFDSQFGSIVKPYTFNFAAWEYHALLDQAKDNLSGASSSTVQAAESDVVQRYFSYGAEIDQLQASDSAAPEKAIANGANSVARQIADLTAQRAALQKTVEDTICRQISSVLAEQGLYTPFGKSFFNLTLPPVNFKLEKPLSVLVVSPRERIESIRSVTVKQGLTPAEVEKLEKSVDNLNVSSLVIEIGGLGATYPTFVVDYPNLKWIIETAAHEWLHQYLVFRPLGFGYLLDVLGMPIDPSVITINETVASIAGQEIGDLVYERYYAPGVQKADGVIRPPEPGAFDFNKEMREIRLSVDALLAAGKVTEAETLMNQKQEYLASKGYSIRKLNQAYFAFYGSYADSPTSVDPTGNKLKIVRQHTASVKDFLNAVDNIRSTRDLDTVVARYSK